jgi:hypothetical protein
MRTKSIITDYFTELGSDNPIILEVANKAEEWSLRASERAEEEAAATEAEESEGGATELCPNFLAAYEKLQSLQASPTVSDDEAAGKGKATPDAEEGAPEPANALAEKMQAALDCEDTVLYARADRLLRQCRMLVAGINDLEQVPGGAPPRPL